MAKSANPGELRTPVIVEAITKTNDSEGYETKTWTNVFGSGKKLMVKWVNDHGTEVYEGMGLALREPATITCRYSALITPQCRITKDDNGPFEIISLDNVEERGRWIEIKVQRVVSP